MVKYLLHVLPPALSGNLTITSGPHLFRVSSKKSKTPKFAVAMMAQTNINEADLTRMTSRLTAYLKRHAELSGIETRNQIFDLFDKMNLMFPHWIIMTCPVMHPDICYVSENSRHIFGNSGIQINERDIDKFFRQVHDADKSDLHNCLDFIHDYFQAVPPGQHHLYRWVCYYRLKKNDGQQIYIHDEKAALVLPGTGNLYYAMIRDITDEKPFEGVKVIIFKQENSLRKEKEYKPSAHNKILSTREGQLLTLIKMGLSTKEIAHYLKLSHNTVRNIKSRMFTKFNVSSSIELLNVFVSPADVRTGN